MIVRGVSDTSNHVFIPVNHPKLGGCGILGSGENTDQKKSENKSSSKTTINHDARESNPGDNSPDENRCLFFTFSQGYPLNEIQISCVFTMRYGACVDKVYVDRAERKDEGPKQAVFAKVVFNTSITPTFVLVDGGW